MGKRHHAAVIHSNFPGSPKQLVSLLFPLSEAQSTFHPIGHGRGGCWGQFHSKTGTAVDILPQLQFKIPAAA